MESNKSRLTSPKSLVNGITYFEGYCYHSVNEIVWPKVILLSGVHCSLGQRVTDNYSGCRLMGSRIMGSIGLWDHFYPDQKVPNFSSIPNFTLILICLLVSIAYWNQFAPVRK